jgi:ABC-2 type transport system ATP-binding protein
MSVMIDPIPPVRPPRAAADDAVIRFDGLTRYFGGKCAVDSVTLDIPRGSVFAMLGRNGSGKSTLVRMLLGMLSPTRGSATILGDDCQNIRPQTRGKIGYVAEGHPFIDGMRVRDLSSFQRSFYPNWDQRTFDAVISQFSLDSKTRAGNLSRGQRAGLSLALVLATRPELLVMDDPALGLDPVARRTLLEAMILVTRQEGHTIFFTSHEIADVERVADHVAIMDQSVLRVAAPVDAFRAKLRRLALSFTSGDPPHPPSIKGLLQSRRQDSELILTLIESDDPVERAAVNAAIASLSAASTRELSMSLEDGVVAFLCHRDVQPSLLQQEGMS